MSNDFLAAISGILPGTGHARTNAGKAELPIEGADFSSLLQSRLNLGQSVASRSIEGSSGFFTNKSSVESLNPLLISGAETRFVTADRFGAETKSEFRQKSDNRAESYGERKSLEQKSPNEVSLSRKKQDATEDGELSASKDRASEDIDSDHVNNEIQTDEKAEAVTEDQLASLQALLENLEPEEQATLLQLIQSLPPEDLQVVVENPEEAVANLLEITDKMPDSELKQSLLALFEDLETTRDSELETEAVEAGLVDATLMTDKKSADALPQEVIKGEEAETSAVRLESLSMQGSTEPETNVNEAEVNAENVSEDQASATNIAETEVMKRVIAETEVKTKVETASSAATTGESTEPGKEEALSESSEEVKLNKDDGAVDTDKKQKRSGNDSPAADKLAQKLEEAGLKEPTGNRESLRQEFERLHENVKSEEVEVATVEEGTSGSNETAQPAGTAPQGTADFKSAAEDFAKKLFTALNEKTSNNAPKKEEASFTAASEGLRRNTQASGGSGNSGMSNGFSFQSGASTSASQTLKQNAAAAAPNMAFADLLEKAEFVKTRDGGKVLNIELDPEALGKVEMELTSKDGNVTARISAESALAKAKLDELAPQIKEQLINQGVNLSEITVDISSRNPDEGNRNQMSGGKNKSGRVGASKNKGDADTIIRKNVLPNLRRAALNIKAVDLTV